MAPRKKSRVDKPVKMWTPPVRKSTGGDRIVIPAGSLTPGKKLRIKSAAPPVEEVKLFERKVPLPTDHKWRGWSDDMPPEYYRCASCAVAPGKDGKIKHLKNCPKPNARGKWSCPSCSVFPGKDHEQWCPRRTFAENPYISTAYDSDDFLSRAGFTKQIWHGTGHPTADESRVALFLTMTRLQAAGQRIYDPWRFPTLAPKEMRLAHSQPVELGGRAELEDIEREREPLPF